jgi:recombination protein RecT
MGINTTKTADKLKSRAKVVGAVNSVPASPEQREVAKQEEKKGMALILEQMEPEIKKALPETMKSERMIRLALTAFRNNQRLKQCDPYSFVAAVMQASQLGLEPNTPLGESYIIPYGKEATFQMGYKGVLSLAHRTGQYATIYAHEVYENDTFKHELGLHKKLVHIPADVQTGEIKYYYAVYHLINGGYDFVVWSKKKVKIHAEMYSRAFKDPKSPWSKNFDSMAKKTVLIELLRYAPKSIEFSQQLSMDNTTKKDVNSEPERVVIDMEEEESGQQEHMDQHYYGDIPPEEPEQFYR